MNVNFQRHPGVPGPPTPGLLVIFFLSFLFFQSDGPTQHQETHSTLNEGDGLTSWFAIALAEIRTRRILREKADCKQSRLSLLSVAKDNWKQFQCLYAALNNNNNGPLFLEFCSFVKR